MKLISLGIFMSYGISKPVEPGRYIGRFRNGLIIMIGDAKPSC